MKRFAALLSLVLVAAVASPGSSQKTPPPAQDRHGDPLPKGAVARIGTVRFQQGGSSWCLGFSPDGKVLSAGGEKGLLQWDASTGKALGQITDGDVAALSPDGQTMLSVVRGTPKLVDIARGKSLHELRAPNGQGAPWSFSPDGRAIAAGAFDGPIEIWNTNTGRRLGEVGKVRPGVNFLALSPNGRLVAEGGAEKTMQIWEVATGKEQKPIEARGRSLERAVFSPDGKLIAAVDVEALDDSTVRLWDVSAGKEVASFKGSGPLEFSPDGKVLAAHAGSIYGDDWVRVLLWDVASSKERGTLKGHANAVRSCVFSPDGKRLAASTVRDDLIYVWDLASGKEVPALVRTFPSSLAFLPDGKSLAVANETGPVQVWDTAAGTMLRQFGTPERRLAGVAFTPDGLAVVTNYGESKSSVWSVDDGKPLGTVDGRRQRLTGVAVTRNGPTVALANERAVVLHKFAAPPPERDATLLPVWVTATDKSTNLAILEKGTKPGLLKLPKLDNGEALRADDNVIRLAFSADGQHLATVGREVQLWDPTAAKMLRRLPASAGSVAFSPDRKTVATGARESGAVILWDLATGKERGRLKGHLGIVQVLAFSPDGKKLASGSQDATILIWDVPESK